VANQVLGSHLDLNTANLKVLFAKWLFYVTYLLLGLWDWQTYDLLTSSNAACSLNKEGSGDRLITVTLLKLCFVWRKRRYEQRGWVNLSFNLAYKTPHTLSRSLIIQIKLITQKYRTIRQYTTLSYSKSK
jgi:hypothetical protein